MTERPPSPHPRPELLNGFLVGSLEPTDRHRVVAHLLPGCAACTATMAPLVAALRGRSLPRATAREEERYELPVRRAMAAARRVDEARAAVEAEVVARVAAVLCGGPAPATAAAGEPHHRAVCEQLFLLVEAGRFAAPDRVRIAEMAADLVDRLAPTPRRSPEHVADLRARARANLGNARRVAGDLEGAETELALAVDLLERGSGDPLLDARVRDLLGSLYRAQRRFDDAKEVLAVACAIYLEQGEPHLAGRTLVNKGIVHGYASQTGEALATYTRAFELLDARREPALVLAAIKNTALFLVDAGHLVHARDALWQARRLSKAHGSPLDRSRLAWVEGHLEAAYGHFDRAEGLFRSERAAFEAAEQPYDAALVSLDLGSVLLDLGRMAEAVPVLDQALVIFRRLKIDRETLAALALLCRAARAGEAAGHVVRAVAAELQRVGRLQPEKVGRMAAGRPAS